MTTLTKIGNSQGIRIPKPLIQQAHLENASLELEVLENGLLIKPVNNI
ncbi:MAG: AbrB/MazE/SpoVT family DNA-binding domain-containing protein, partial [Campylobacterota bacterium]|nr:AbrB/MazE/SpoVT family DNA-binding domain-containing protein [Campylobacterota bacterium]